MKDFNEIKALEKRLKAEKEAAGNILLNRKHDYSKFEEYGYITDVSLSESGNEIDVTIKGSMVVECNRLAVIHLDSISKMIKSIQYFSLFCTSIEYIGEKENDLLFDHRESVNLLSKIMNSDKKDLQTGLNAVLITGKYYKSLKIEQRIKAISAEIDRLTEAMMNSRELEAVRKHLKKDAVFTFNLDRYIVFDSGPVKIEKAVIKKINEKTIDVVLFWTNGVSREKRLKRSVVIEWINHSIIPKYYTESPVKESLLYTKEYDVVVNEENEMYDFIDKSEYDENTK